MFDAPVTKGSYSGSRYDDETGYKRGLGAYAADDAAFRRPSWEGDYRDAPHEKLAGLIDDSQPYDPLLPGGAPLTHGKDVGHGRPRYEPKTGKISNMRRPK